MEMKYDMRLETEVASLLQTFKATSRREQAIYDYLKVELGRGARVEDRLWDVAQLAGANLLSYLYSRDSGAGGFGIRKAVVMSPRCPAGVLIEALKDSDWEVRKSAVLRPETPLEACFAAARKEWHPIVIEAMKERLGDDFIRARNYVVEPVAKSQVNDKERELG